MRGVWVSGHSICGRLGQPLENSGGPACPALPEESGACEEEMRRDENLGTGRQQHREEYRVAVCSDSGRFGGPRRWLPTVPVGILFRCSTPSCLFPFMQSSMPFSKGAIWDGWLISRTVTPSCIVPKNAIHPR